MLLVRVLAVTALAAFLISRVRLRFRLAFADERVNLCARFGWFTFWQMPAPKTKRRKRPKRKREKPPEEEKPAERRGPPVWEAVREALRTMPEPVRKALVRVLRGVRVHPLTLTLTIGGEKDPPAAAQRYGERNAVMWTVMPLLEQILDIPKPDLRVDIDFDAPRSRIEGEACVSVRLGTLLAAGVTVGVPALLLLRSLSEMAEEDINTDTQPDTDTETHSDTEEDEALSASRGGKDGGT